MKLHIGRVATSALFVLAACTASTPRPADSATGAAPALNASQAAPPQGAPKATQLAAGSPADPSVIEAPAIVAPPQPRAESPNYAQVVSRVVSMNRDAALRRRARQRGLDVVNVAWEDTGRAHGSALGPNISDLTLQVTYKDARGHARKGLMPVLRFPNFSDRTGDIKQDRFFVRTGNHKKKQSLATTPLASVLRNMRMHLSRPWDLKGSGSLLAARDTHFVVSAQAVFLPVPAEGKAEFVPVVFNYQSAPGSPAVLTLLATRQGTSVSIIENRDDDAPAYGAGQELYFNQAGKRARFTAERFKEVKARIDAQGGPKNEDERSAISRSSDVIFLIQVPLVHKQRGYLGGLMGGGSGVGYGYGGLGLSGVGQGGGGVASGGIGLGSVGTLGHGSGRGAPPKSDVDRAVIGHGDVLGLFHEARGLELRRDARFPIRITVQFYKATSNGVVSDDDLAAIEKSIGSVYEHADFVGSLVVPDGDRRRPTEWQTMPNEWFPW